MKKSSHLTSKRTFDRKIEARIGKIRTAENIEMSTFRAYTSDHKNDRNATPSSNTDTETENDFEMTAHDGDCSIDSDIVSEIEQETFPIRGEMIMIMRTR